MATKRPAPIFPTAYVIVAALVILILLLAFGAQKGLLGNQLRTDTISAFGDNNENDAVYVPGLLATEAPIPDHPDSPITTEAPIPLPGDNPTTTEEPAPDPDHQPTICELDPYLCPACGEDLTGSDPTFTDPTFFTSTTGTAGAICAGDPTKPPGTFGPQKDLIRCSLPGSELKKPCQCKAVWCKRPDGKIIDLTTSVTNLPITMLSCGYDKNQVIHNFKQVCEKEVGPRYMQNLALAKNCTQICADDKCKEPAHIPSLCVFDDINFNDTNIRPPDEVTACGPRNRNLCCKVQKPDRTDVKCNGCGITTKLWKAKVSCNCQRPNGTIVRRGGGAVQSCGTQCVPDYQDTSGPLPNCTETCNNADMALANPPMHLEDCQMGEHPWCADYTVLAKEWEDFMFTRPRPEGKPPSFPYNSLNDHEEPGVIDPKACLYSDFPGTRPPPSTPNR